MYLNSSPEKQVLQNVCTPEEVACVVADHRLEPLKFKKKILLVMCNIAVPGVFVSVLSL